MSRLKLPNIDDVVAIDIHTHAEEPCGLHGDDADGVFATIEHDYGDAATGNYDGYGEYDSGLLGGFGVELYGYGKCCCGGGELCGFEY